jgi:Polyketide cyclase / dehydrase and lipid transport
MSHRFFLSFLAICFALTATASATEVRRKVEFTGKIPEVWAKIGGWCALADWHPAIAKCEEKDEGGKKHRVLTTKDGGVIKESMIKSDAASYTYQIDESPLPVANYVATLAVVPDRDDKDEVNVVWSAKFDPKGASEADAQKAITGIFKAGLDAIRAKLK